MADRVWTWGLKRLGFTAEVINEALEPEGEGQGRHGWGSQKPVLREKTSAKCCPEVVKDWALSTWLTIQGLLVTLAGPAAMGWESG